MEPTFWHERWQQHQIGFHQLRINLLLKTFWHQSIQQDRGMVFVPLCSEGLDMLWLSQQGHGVFGVEINPIAVRNVFREQGLQPIEGFSRKPCRCFQSQNIRLFCGDFFDLIPDWLSDVDAIYDRAALVALPPKVQKRYASKLLPHPPTHLLDNLGVRSQRNGWAAFCHPRRKRIPVVRERISSRPSCSARRADRRAGSTRQGAESSRGKEPVGYRPVRLPTNRARPSEAMTIGSRNRLTDDRDYFAAPCQALHKWSCPGSPNHPDLRSPTEPHGLPC